MYNLSKKESNTPPPLCIAVCPPIGGASPICTSNAFEKVLRVGVSGKLSSVTVLQAF